LENVTKKYKDKTAVCNVTATMRSGQLIGLVGKNGAGKTTLGNPASGCGNRKGRAEKLFSAPASL